MQKPPPLPAYEIERFHDSLSNWGRFGKRDQLGTLNLISNQKRVEASFLIL